jgi:CheY-like chemotaxis protein
VLVAEDNPVNRKVVVRMLEKRGHDVVAVGDGQAALAAIEQPFDLVLMDVQMPRMDGIEATMAIRDREKERGGHLPIVALTAHAMKGDRERCLSAGMDAYVAKPVEPAELFAAIESLGDTTPAKPTDDNQQGHANGVAVLDQSVLQARLEGDVDLVREVISDFQRDSSQMLLRLTEAIMAHDFKGISRTAHSLKGALATLAAMPASEAAAFLDHSARAGDREAIDRAWTALQLEMSRLESEFVRQ